MKFHGQRGRPPLWMLWALGLETDGGIQVTKHLDETNEGTSYSVRLAGLFISSSILQLLCSQYPHTAPCRNKRLPLI